MQIILRILSSLLSPVAIGTYVTFAVTFAAYNYYFFVSYPSEQKSSLFKVVEFVHQKTIDFRLLARGPRKGSPRVAILDIDDRSLQVLGRWPWQRTVTAKVIDEVMKYQPSVISFDIAFSEEMQNPVQRSFSKLRNTLGINSPELDEFIDREIQDHNQDLRLAEVVEKHSDSLVMGSFFDNEDMLFRHHPYKNKCKSVAFSITRGAEVFDNEEVPPIAATAEDYDLPEPLVDLLIEKFEETADEVVESYLQEKGLESANKLTQSKKDILEFTAYEKNVFYCRNFLNLKDEPRLGQKTDPLLEEIQEIWDEVIDDDPETFQGLSFADAVEVIRTRGKFNPIKAAEKYWFNIPVVSEAAKHNGFFVANLDNDGTIRKAHLASRIGDSVENYLLPISFKAYLVATGNNVVFHLSGNEGRPTYNAVKKVEVIDREGKPLFDIPVDASGNMRINYAGPHKMFPYISAAEFANDDEYATIQERRYNVKTGEWEVEPKGHRVKKSEFLKDKILLFGPSATGIFDLRVTPFEENYPGVETHANVLDNILRQDFLRNYPNESVIMLSVLLFGGLFISFLIAYLGALSGLICTLLSIGGIVMADYSLYFSQGTVTTIMFPVFLTFSLYVSMTFYKYFTEERKKKELRGTFSKYVSPAIVDEILKDPNNIELGGKKQRITVFFSDVRGFTTISEKLDPQALSDLLNSYLTPMTELVFEHKGTLDKYMGDAIMAFFGAPIPFEDHAKYACRCALAHLEKLKLLQKEYEQQGLPLLDVGIGLNTGEMSVGNMGSNTIRSYTVMGDAVNLGARLEGINKQYGTRIIISEFTYNEVSPDFTCREVDWVRVKGKEEPVRIFELVCEGEAKGDQAELLRCFNQGFSQYHTKQFNEAINSFTAGLNVVPDDFCSKMYIERCHGYLESAPPEDWDGVFVMKTK